MLLLFVHPSLILHILDCLIQIVLSERYAVNTQLLRSLFRPSVCNARELCPNGGF